MKRFGKLSVSVLVVACLLLTGCGGDPHEKAAKEQIAGMEKLVSLLESVKDEASAKAAAPKIEALTKKMDEVTKRIAEMEKPAPEQMEALEKKYQPQVEELMKKLMKEVMRVAMNPALSKELEGAMKGLQN